VDELQDDADALLSGDEFRVLPDRDAYRVRVRFTGIDLPLDGFARLQRGNALSLKVQTMIGWDRWAGAGSQRQLILRQQQAKSCKEDSATEAGAPKPFANR
jgi:hypothetical protein